MGVQLLSERYQCSGVRQTENVKLIPAGVCPLRILQCVSRWVFKWASFTENLGTLQSAASVTGESVSHGPLLTVSQFKLPWLSNIEVLEAHLSSAGLKRWGAWCGVKPVSVSGSLLIIGNHNRGTVYGEIMPACFGMGFCPRGDCSIHSYRFSVSMWGGEFRIFLRCHLELNLLNILSLSQLG